MALLNLSPALIWAAARATNGRRVDLGVVGSAPTAWVISYLVPAIQDTPRAQLALTEAVTGNPDVIVGGIYLRSNASTNLGVVTVGQTDITHALGANASALFSRTMKPAASAGAGPSKTARAKAARMARRG